jgi:imidazolonepropionase-like amidohydrolase
MATKFICFSVFLVITNLGNAQDLLITNARVIDGAGRTIESGSILIADGRVVSVNSGDIDPGGVVRVDARGMTAMPGMINTHWHLLSGVSDEDVDRRIEDTVAPLLESLLARGVTTIMAPGGHFPKILDVREMLANGEMRGPRLLAVGPVFTAPNDWPTRLCGGNSYCLGHANAEMTSPEEARAKVRELAAAGVDAVKLVYDDQIEPDVRIADDVVAAIAEEAAFHGLVTFAHISTAEETTLKLVGFGIRGLVHPVPFRTAASTNGARTLRELQIPVSTTISNWTREWRELTGREYSEQDETIFSRRLEDIKHLWDEGVTVAFGTDSVAGQSSLAEGRFLAEARALNQVLSNEEVITTLTRNAAVYLGLGDELGTLESGKIADLILIDGDPLADISDLTNVEVVIQGGRVVVDNR